MTALASHTSGLPRLPSMEGCDPADPYAHFDDARFWTAVKTITVGDASFGYSNFGAAMLGQLLAAHLERPYEALVRERILEPLAMNDTGFEKNALAPGHAFYGGDGGSPFSARASSSSSRPPVRTASPSTRSASPTASSCG